MRRQDVGILMSIGNVRWRWALPSLIAALALVLFAGAFDPQAKTGSPAPKFEAQGTDGKAHSLESLTSKGPMLLYFIKEGCPVNHQAAPLLAKTAKAYHGKANLVGVYNGSLSRARAWAKKYGATFLILADPEYKVIRAYGAPFSPYLIEVTKGGKLGSLIGDGSAPQLAAANRLLASTAGMKPASLDFSAAPRGGG